MVKYQKTISGALQPSSLFPESLFLPLLAVDIRDATDETIRDG